MNSKRVPAANDCGWTKVGTAKDSKGYTYYCWQREDEKGPYFNVTNHSMGPFQTHLSGYRNLDALLKLKGLTKEKK
jgi:hypothetical protein